MRLRTLCQAGTLVACQRVLLVGEDFLLGPELLVKQA